MDTPSARLVAEARMSRAVNDSLGRKLEIRRMTALDRLRLFKTVGAELAENPPYLGMAMLAASVVAIDDIPVPQPITEPQLEALVLRLGDEGIAAVAQLLADLQPPDLGSITQGN